MMYFYWVRLQALEVWRIMFIFLSNTQVARNIRDKSSTTKHRPHIRVIKWSPKVMNVWSWSS
jgi:hypothetical protein